MAKQREREVVNPLLKDRAVVIAAPPTPSRHGAKTHQAEIDPGHPSEISLGNTSTLTAQKRMPTHIKARVSRETAEEIERFTRTLSSYLGITIKGAEVTRALWSIVIRSSDQFGELPPQHKPLKRPSNGNKLAMAEFEDALAAKLLHILRCDR